MLNCGPDRHQPVRVHASVETGRLAVKWMCNRCMSNWWTIAGVAAPTATELQDVHDAYEEAVRRETRRIHARDPARRRGAGPLHAEAEAVGIINARALARESQDAATSG